MSESISTVVTGTIFISLLSLYQSIKDTILIIAVIVKLNPYENMMTPDKRIYVLTVILSMLT